MPKKLDERIKELDDRIKQLQAQKQQFLNKNKADERKKRTKNLIDVGATMNTIGMRNPKQANAFKERLGNKPEFLEWFNSIMKEFEEIIVVDPKQDYKENNTNE